MYSVKELKSRCRQRGLKGYSKFNKYQLTRLLNDNPMEIIQHSLYDVPYILWRPIFESCKFRVDVILMSKRIQKIIEQYYIDSGSIRLLWMYHLSRGHKIFITKNIILRGNEIIPSGISYQGCKNPHFCQYQIEFKRKIMFEFYIFTKSMNQDIFQIYLENIHPDDVEKHGWMISRSKHHNLVKEFFTKYPDAVTSRALIEALYERKFPNAIFLLENGADPNKNLVIPRRFSSPINFIELACADYKTIASMVKHGVNVNTQNGGIGNHTVLHYLYSNNKNIISGNVRRNRAYKVMRLLLDNGANPDIPDNFGFTFRLMIRYDPFFRNLL